MNSTSRVNRFEELIVWQKSMSLAEDVYRITRQGGFAKDWGLRDQVRKAAVSIPSNIAEGFERYSAGELKQFLNIAKGSAGELRTQLILARNLGYIGPLEAETYLKLCEEISRMLAGYRKNVARKN